MPPLKIASLNVGEWHLETKSQEKFNILCQMLEANNVDVALIQETRVNLDMVNTTQYKCFFSHFYKCTHYDSLSLAGVAILIKKSLEEDETEIVDFSELNQRNNIKPETLKSAFGMTQKDPKNANLMKCYSFDSRVLAVKLKRGDRNVYFVNVYAPTKDTMPSGKYSTVHRRERWELFFQPFLEIFMEKVVQMMQPNDCFVVAGDFNDSADFREDFAYFFGKQFEVLTHEGNKVFKQIDNEIPQMVGYKRGDNSDFLQMDRTYIYYNTNDQKHKVSEYDYMFLPNSWPEVKYSSRFMQIIEKEPHDEKESTNHYKTLSLNVNSSADGSNSTSPHSVILYFTSCEIKLTNQQQQFPSRKFKVTERLTPRSEVEKFLLQLIVPKGVFEMKEFLSDKYGNYFNPHFIMFLELNI